MPTVLRRLFYTADEKHKSLREIISLDLNESYWLLDQTVYEECCRIPLRAFATYPDYQLLIDDIAAYAGVKAAAITIGPGSDEIIQASMEFCRTNAPQALLPLPTFSGYERVLTRVPLKVSRVYYRESGERFLFPLDEVRVAIENGQVNSLFLCSPNNPLGPSLSRPEMDTILDAARVAGVLVVCDEAYAEFTGESCIDRVADQPLIVLRTLSKAFGVPGIRVGYAISSPNIARELTESIRGVLPWPIAGPSVYAARTVIKHAARLKQRCKLLVEQRAKFYDALRGIEGLTAYPSDGNFILMRVRDAQRVADAMLKDGIRIGVGERKTWDDRSRRILKSTVRMAIPSPEDLQTVLQSLEKTLSEILPMAHLGLDK